MEKAFIISIVLLVLLMTNSRENTYSLHIKVENLQNSKGTVVLALYNKEGSIPDEKLKKYYKKEQVTIADKKAELTFSNLPRGLYAVTILHDENNNEKIDKKFMLPLPEEGIGFSNYNDFGLNKRPNFKNASFNLNKDTTIAVKVIYK